MCTQISDDSSDARNSTTPDKALAGKGLMTGRTNVAELDGCCRTVVGSVKVALKKGSAYYTMGRVNEVSGGENLNVGMQKFTGKVMPIPMSMFDSGKSVKCGPDIDGKMTTGYACRHWWFDVGGVKIPDPINQENYKTFKTGLGQVMTPSADSGLFEITGNDVFTTDNNMGSQLEGFIKAPADGDYFFYVYRSARPSSRPAGSDRSRRCCYGCCYGCSRLRLAVLVCSLTPSHRAWHHPRPLFACERSNSDDSSEVWASDVDGFTPFSPKSNDGLKKVVELNGCCREVSGTVKVTMKKGSSYYIMGHGKEGGGGEYKTFAPDKSEEMAVGTNFRVNRDDIKRQGLYSTNNMGSMIEGWFKVAEDGDYLFFTRRSVRP